MERTLEPIFIGDTQIKGSEHSVSGEYVDLFGETFYKIQNFDGIPPFFVSLVSSSDHWLFISSTGGLTAGRVSAEQALFPYYTEDKLAENSENTGSKTILLIQREGKVWLWEPFSIRQQGPYDTQRNLYKNIPGTVLVFEEINHSLGLTYRYAWRTSNRFGFVRTVWLQNNLAQPCHVRLLDGMQNLLPYGATTVLQTTMSNLLDAYKRNELEPTTGLGIFALSATLTDRAEPSESLMATVAWQVGLHAPTYLLSTAQLPAFRRGQPIVQETDIKGQRAAYLVCADLDLAGSEEQSWSLVADVNQDHSQLAALCNLLRGDAKSIAQQLELDIACGSAEWNRLVASADGLQVSAEPLTTTHHFANVAFNIMRGGVFVDNDQVETRDLREFMQVRNRNVSDTFANFFAGLPDKLTIHDLYTRAATTGAPDLIRLCYEYLPLTFSRRHGDPSRPWNRFTINLRRPDGGRRLDFEGNWRDIFQNWEPLAYSFPMFVEGMIARFLNAITADGYNPYRLTRSGIEWEAPEPNNPWANIGYWSDHQIIYLQKLLESAARFHPGELQALLHQQIFSHADVPYRIRPYAQTMANPYDTIEFDWERERMVAARVAALGTDGKLMTDAKGNILHVSLAEKLLLLLLVKLTNLVPEGGIWMNTQRPEWNDANNALVGKGLSVVTTAYVRRTLVFCRTLFAAASSPIDLTGEVKNLLDAVTTILAQHKPLLATGFSDGQRRLIMDRLGEAGSDYRWRIYSAGVSDERVTVPTGDIVAWLDLALAYIDQTLHANRRSDGLFHAYNILHLRTGVAEISRLYAMLEGQVAILSSRLLESAEALTLLRNLRASALYRADQHSYILYPDRQLPGFLAKNQITAEHLEGLSLVDRLIERNDRALLVRDENGVFHFNGAFRNAQGVAAALEQFRHDAELAPLVETDGQRLLDLFESTFDHHSFTGRSGTFFAYEGLGSIYWHMVAKLLLAVQENFWWARADGADRTTLDELATAYYAIRAGIGFNKSPAVYGAFPTDPYSHTPKGQGAKQPGMTGQVKEEILTRLGELGVRVDAGALLFDPALLRPQEFMAAPVSFEYVGLDGQQRVLSLPANALAFTLCQTPVILVRAGHSKIEVVYTSGQRAEIEGNRLVPVLAQHLFRRDGEVAWLMVSIP